MNKRLRILALTSWYPNENDPQLGGFIQHQLEAIGKKHDVTLLTLNQSRGEKATKVITNNHFEYRAYFYQPKLGMTKKIEWFFCWKNILTKLKEKEFDLIHVHVIFPIGIIALMARKVFNLPIIISEHWSGYSSKKEYRGILRKKITQVLVKRSAKIIVQSDYLKDKMRESNIKSQYSIVPNIVRFDTGIKHQEESRLKQVVFMNIADHIDSNKNISGLLRAFSEALKLNPNICLIQIGDGKDGERLRALANELKLNVIWKGRMPNNKVLSEIHKCNYGIVNSNQETFCISAFEFLVAQKPIVITDCGGPIPYLPKSFGIKTPVNNEQMLTKAILKLASNKNEIVTAEISEQVKLQFSEKAFLDRIEIEYKNTLGN